MIDDSNSNRVYDVVRYCIWGGVSVEDFIACAKECWEDVLRDEIKSSNRKFDKLKGF
jgi:hypothetical protein